MELVEKLKLSNNGNEQAKYWFKIPENCPFQIEETEGYVLAGKSKRVEILYKP